MALIEKNYFKSKDVRVFPSSFRGTYDNTTFDPEARLNTEANFIVPKISGNKASYIVNYNTNTIKFVLGGYYFEINNITDYDLKDQYLNIKLRDITIAENQNTDNKDSERKTFLLDTWEANSDHILDFLDENTNISYFTGLKISEETPEENAYASIKLFYTIKDKEDKEKAILNQEAILVDLDHGTGENTLMHGVGLTAATINQTVFGTYNDNKANNLFEVGNGSGDTNKHNALEISTTTVNINNNTNINGETVITGATKIDGSTEITNNTEIKGIVNISNDTESESTTTGALKVAGGVGVSKNLNVNGNANLTNKVIIKATPSEDETNVKVDGTLNVTGKTDIYNNITVDSAKTTLAKPVEITDNSDNALVVKGKTTIEKDLEIGNNTKILAVKNSPSTGEQNVTITGTLKSTDKATFENGLEVASGKTTELGGQVNITGAVNINTSNQTNPGNINIYGETEITGKVTINGKATSNSTTSTDESTTLTTKDYVDSKINSLDVDSVGADGSYLKTISEKDGRITATAQAFDKTIKDSDNNAPTSKAVKDFTSTELNKLSINKVGGTETVIYDGKELKKFSYISSIKQSAGKIEATSNSIAQTFVEGFKDHEKIASAKATKEYIDNNFSSLTNKQTTLETNLTTVETTLKSKNLICLNDRNSDFAIYYGNSLTGSGRTSSYSSANWDTFELSTLSIDSSKWKIVNVVVSDIIKTASNYSQQTWNIGKDDGDYLQAENTMYWSNSMKVWWDDDSVWFLNTNAKRTTHYSYILVLKRK